MVLYVAYDDFSGSKKNGNAAPAQQLLPQDSDKNVVGNQLIPSASQDERAPLPGPGRATTP